MEITFWWACSGTNRPVCSKLPHSRQLCFQFNNMFSFSHEVWLFSSKSVWWSWGQKELKMQKIILPHLNVLYATGELGQCCSKILQNSWKYIPGMCVNRIWNFSRRKLIDEVRFLAICLTNFIKTIKWQRLGFCVVHYC